MNHVGCIIMTDWRKVYTPGTLVLWPGEVTASIANALRSQYDPESQRICPAHITLTQPFLDLPNTDDWAKLAAIGKTVKPFLVTVGPIETFGTSAVLKFDVEPKSGLLALRQALHDTGLFNLNLPFTEGFTPHLTISEYGVQEPSYALELAQSLNKTTPVTTFMCSEFAYIRPDANRVFSHVRTVRLGD